jgi:hypothetical protein
MDQTSMDLYSLSFPLSLEPFELRTLVLIIEPGSRRIFTLSLYALVPRFSVAFTAIVTGLFFLTIFSPFALLA